MLRAVIAVIAGYAAWTLIWVGSHSTIFAEAGKIAARGELNTNSRTLLGMIALSIVCSLAAGLACGLITPARRGPALTLGLLLLATGLGVQLTAWKLFPVWYHLTFLALVVPVTLLGAALAARLGRRHDLEPHALPR